MPLARRSRNQRPQARTGPQRRALTRWQAADRYYARNQRIVDDSDRVIAFVAPDRTGGTEDTIRWAVRAGKPVEVR